MPTHLPLPPPKPPGPRPYIPDTSLGLTGWAFIAAFALLGGVSAAFVGCTKVQGVAIETALTKAGCALVAVLSHDEQVGTLCEDIAPAVETEIAAMAADGSGAGDPSARSLMGHRSRRHGRMRRLAAVAPGRDPGETVEEGAPMDATLRVLARRAGK